MLRGSKFLLFGVLFFLFFLPSSSAVIFHGTFSNQDVFRNGDLIVISVETNTRDLEVTADFSRVDSNFESGMVLVEADGTVYDIVYPITFSNARSDGSKAVLLNFYDPSSASTSSISYVVELNNVGPRLVDSEEVVIRVLDERELFKVERGKIQICDASGCEVFTEEEYNAMREIIIKDGNVTLSDLTYNQLRDEISDEANKQIREELGFYLDELERFRRAQDDAFFDLRNLYTEQHNLSLEAEARSNRLFRNTVFASIGSVLLVLFVVSFLVYFIYLRTETTWYRR